VLDQLQQSSADATNGPDSVSPTSTSSASTVVSCDENDEEDENDDETIDVSCKKTPLSEPMKSLINLGR